MPDSILLCDCAGTMKLDREAIAKATGCTCSRVHSTLCTTELQSAAEALKASQGTVLIACQQEAETFELLAQDIGLAPAATSLEPSR